MSSKDYIYCYQGSALRVAGSTAVIGETSSSPVDPYNPLGLPPFTIRVKFKSGYTPTMGDSRTLVDAGENVWDITKNSTDWSKLFYKNNFVQAILGANTANVTNMLSIFEECRLLLRCLTVFNTESCINMNSMFYNTALIEVPLFNTSSCTDMKYMFGYCTKVESGALALYQQASSQTNIPLHTKTFFQCGTSTTTGQAELAQIPSDWK